MFLNIARPFLAALAAGLFLVACGGGGSGAVSGGGGSGVAAAASMLSGTVAGGAAVIGSVVVTDSKGVTRSAAIDPLTGHYAVDVSGMTGPFLLKAVGTLGRFSVFYYSAATSADVGGTVNITPFTNLVVSNVVGQMAQTLFDDPAQVANIGSLITGAKLEQAEREMRAQLQPVLDSLGLGSGVDLLRTAFTANHTGVDALLDLVKVEVDLSTNVATLINTITRNAMASNNVADRQPKAPVVAFAEITPGAAADLGAIVAVLDDFAALFATALPTPAALQNSGVFDTSSAFRMGGQTFSQFAVSASSQAAALGLKFGNVSVALQPSGVAGGVSARVFSNTATFADRVPLRLAKVNGRWLVQGDGMIANLALVAQAQRDSYTLLNSAPANGSSGTISSNGIWIHIDPSAYNANNAGNPIASATLTGPGLGADGVTLVKNPAYAALTVQGAASGAKLIPECSAQRVQQCVNVSQALDNSAYTVVLKDAGGNSIPGAAYGLVLTKQPFAGSAVLPVITSVTIDGVALTPAAVQANKTVVVNWTLPGGFQARNLNVWATTSTGALLFDIERGLAAADVTASVGLGTPALANGVAANAGVWFSAVDAFGRRVVLSHTVSNR